MAVRKKYLVVFAHAFEEFRLPELLTVCEINNIEITHEEYSNEHPFLVISVPRDKDIPTILNRCVMIQFIVEIWEECVSRQGLRAAKFQDITPLPGSFNILLHSFGRKVPMQDKIDLIEDIQHLPLTGDVNCTNPDHVFYICENYKPKSEPGQPYLVYFGPLVGRSNRSIIDKFSVKKRLYIGRTTMDAQLSYVMANLAMIKRGDLVYDPFLGTGSLIIPAAVHGAYSLGSDIDIKALNGWGKSTKRGEKRYESDQNIEGNMISYGLDKLYLGSHSADFSKPLLRAAPLFDVIITDPPYGVREASLKINSKSGVSQSQFSLSEQFLELLNFAARSLVVGGRLVYWLPVIRDLYSDSSLPQHPSLQLKYNCEQIFSRKSSRRLLVMLKTREISTGDSAFITGELNCHGQYRELYFGKN